MKNWTKEMETIEEMYKIAAAILPLNKLGTHDSKKLIDQILYYMASFTNLLYSLARDQTDEENTPRVTCFIERTYQPLTEDIWIEKERLDAANKNAIKIEKLYNKLV